MASKKSRALDMKCPTCRSNPGVPCDGKSSCGARVKLAESTPDARIDRLEKRIARLETMVTGSEDQEVKR